jgi:Uma2 family endonuclease
MTLAIADNRISEEEYLQGELASEIRHEYVAGNVYAMSGGTLNHQRVAGNFIYLIRRQLVFPSPSPISTGTLGDSRFLMDARRLRSAEVLL